MRALAATTRAEAERGFVGAASAAICLRDTVGIRTNSRFTILPQTYRIAIPGEMAEWLKALPC